jgi:hypothetical protein
LVIVNRTQGPDGGWRTLDSRDLLAHRQAADAIYRATYQHQLSRTLGIAWAEPDRWGNRAIQGMPPELVTVFSKRHEQISAELERLEREEGKQRTGRLIQYVPRPLELELDVPSPEPRSIDHQLAAIARRDGGKRLAVDTAAPLALRQMSKRELRAERDRVAALLRDAPPDRSRLLAPTTEQRRHHRATHQAIERLHERQHTMRERRLDRHERAHADQPRTRPSRADQPRVARADERQRGGREREAG